MLLVEIYEAPDDAPAMALPLYEALVPAGFPSPADDYIDLKLDLNDYLVKRPCATYFAKVSGDSMTGAGIFDGDIIVVDRSQMPSDGKIVVVALNGEITVKRIHYKGAEVMLYPENDKYPVIKLSRQQDFGFWGVVTGVVRKL
jgi:DNA polymerase V